jgi:hypothetical protein
MRLSDPDTLPVAALGLALCRMNELEFAMSPLAGSIAALLMAGQEPDGSFGSVASTAIVVRALVDTLEQPGSEAIAHRVYEAVELAVRFLAWNQGDNGLLFDSEIDSAIAAWQLADCRLFTGAVRIEDLLLALESSPWTCVTAQRFPVFALAS